MLHEFYSNIFSVYFFNIIFFVTEYSVVRGQKQSFLKCVIKQYGHTNSRGIKVGYFPYFYEFLQVLIAHLHRKESRLYGLNTHTGLGWESENRDGLSKLTIRLASWRIYQLLRAAASEENDFKDNHNNNNYLKCDWGINRCISL